MAGEVGWVCGAGTLFRIARSNHSLDLYRLISRNAEYEPVRSVVWAFYYPQVQAILAPGLLLEYLDVRFDELLDELS